MNYCYLVHSKLLEKIYPHSYWQCWFNQDVLFTFDDGPGSNTEDLLPVISFGSKSSKEDKQKHNDFIKRMSERGYSQKQVELVVQWWMRHNKRQ